MQEGILWTSPLPISNKYPFSQWSSMPSQKEFHVNQQCVHKTLAMLAKAHNVGLELASTGNLACIIAPIHCQIFYISACLSQLSFLIDSLSLCLSLSLSLYLCLCLSLSLCFSLPLSVCHCLFVCLSVCLSPSPSPSPSLSLSLSLSVSVSLSLCLFVCLSVNLSLSFSYSLC